MPKLVTRSAYFRYSLELFTLGGDPNTIVIHSNQRTVFSFFFIINPFPTLLGIPSNHAMQVIIF